MSRLNYTRGTSKLRYLGVVLAIVIAATAFVLWRNATAARQGAYELHTVGRDDVHRSVSGAGRVAAINKEMVIAQNGGQIARLSVALGDTVSKGEQLMRMADGRDVLAPRQGEVTSLLVRVNEWVNPGARLLEITDYANLEIIAQVDELDIAKLSVGQQVTVDIIALQNEAVVGQVTSIAREGVIAGGITTFAVRVSLPNPAGIRIGMSAEIKVETARVVNVLVVPLQAIFYEGDQSLVYLQGEKQTLVSQKVELGLSDGVNVEVTRGLQEGQVVVFERSVNRNRLPMGGPFRRQGN